MKDLLKKSLLLGVGALTVTREKAEKMIRELEQKGEVTSGEAREYINELVERGEQERNVLRETVSRELDRLIKVMGLATKSDLKALEERLDSLEARLSPPVQTGDNSGQEAGFPSGE